jgi:hypothetical protein
MNDNLPIGAIYSVNDSVVSDAYPIQFLAAFQLECLSWKRVIGEFLNLLQHPMIVDLGSERRSFSTEGFGTTLKEAIFFQSPRQFLKTHRILVASPSNYREIVQVFH